MNQSNDYMINILEALKTFNDTYIIEQKLALTINLRLDFVIPRHESIDLGTRPSVGDVFQRLGQPCRRVYVVHLAGLQQRGDGCPCAAAAV